MVVILHHFIMSSMAFLTLSVRKVDFTLIIAGGLTRCIAVLIVLDTCSSITDLSAGMILSASSSSIVSSAI